jgi:hypothetical protein
MLEHDLKKKRYAKHTYFEVTTGNPCGDDSPAK